MNRDVCPRCGSPIKGHHGITYPDGFTPRAPHGAEWCVVALAARLRALEELLDAAHVGKLEAAAALSHARSK